jgi:GNAT superfamily N-acetyltransferase
MTPGTIVRRGSETDYDGAVEVYIRTRAASVPAIPPSVHDEEDVRGWFPGFAAKYELWVADDDGAVVGMMMISDTFVEQLYILPSHQGGGTGAELLGIAKRERPGGLQLWAFESNVGARRFYERHGFVEVRRTDGDNEEGAPDVLYQWGPSEPS